MALVISMDGVYTRAGNLSQIFPIAGQLKPPAPWERLNEFGLLIHWERKHDWLNLSARVLPTSGSPVPFGDDLTGLDAVCVKHDVNRAQLAPQAFLESCSYLVASLPSSNQIELTVEVDTDSAGFKEVVESHRDPTTKNVVLPIQLIYFDQKQFKQYVQKASRIDVSFKPCKPLPKFNGAMAIDLGNAVSTMVSLSESSRVYETEAVQIVTLEDRKTPEPTLLTTAIRLDEVHTPDQLGIAGTRRLPSLPSDDSTKHFRYAVGRAAVAGTGPSVEGVVVGVKQLLSVPAYETGNAPEGREPHFPLNVPHRLPGNAAPQSEQMEVMNHFPGELVFAHLIGRFRAEAKAWPADIVLTYPTTYTRGELKQLVTAAARGWLRAMQQPQSLSREPEDSGDNDLNLLVAQVRGWLNNPGRMTAECPVVKLAIDEATAAGFFHIHRRVFEKPGALSRFRYLNPNGTHALVIDCGGGTTDVVMIHAVAPTTKNLKLDILARTGLRGFGGDHITREVCRILKAKLTLTLAKILNAASVPQGLQLPTTGPADGQQALTTVNNFLKKVDTLPKPVHGRDYVPTRFAVNDLSAEATAARGAFRAMWRLGDELKRKLGDGKPVKLSALAPENLRKETSPLIRVILDGLTPQIQAQVTQQLGDISMAPWEVDALVRRQILQIIAKCNKLISGKVKALPSGKVPEVDWVVLSGNGARYPLVQSMCKELLNVAFLDSADNDRFTFDSENLKHAVAKGAVMARLMSRVARTATVEYPPNLSERLPYEVGRQELDTATMQTVFREFTMYADLMNQPAAMTMETGAEGQPQTVVLERKFPGDERWSPFGSYHFPNGVSGPVEAVYDNDENRFRVTAGGEESLFTDLTDPLEHVSPQNRGDF